MKSNRKIAFGANLRSQLRRRRLIAEKVTQLSSQLGSIEAAIATLEDFRCQGASRMPLWKLAEQISNNAI